MKVYSPAILGLRLLRAMLKLLSIGAICCAIYFLLPYSASMQNVGDDTSKPASPEFLIGGNAGDLDPTFLGGGKVSLNLFGNNNDFGNAVARQTDGKIVVAGDLNTQPCVVRYNTDGSLDQTFSNLSFPVKGIACASLGSTTISDVLIQPDGKIVVLGASNVAGTDRSTLVIRFNGDGSLDTTFSSDGIVLYSINSGDDYSIAGALQPDGKLVLGGKVNTFTSSVIRLNADGSLDTGFGFSGGFSSFGYSGYSLTVVNAIAIDSAGRIVVGGSGLSGSTNDAVFTRLTSNGFFDSTFTGGNGAVSVGSGRIAVSVVSGNDYCSGIALQPDGKIVGAGYAVGASSNFSAMRLNTDGSLDNSFDGDGMVQTDLGGEDLGVGVALQADNKLVVFGQSNVTNGTRNEFALVRYNADGSLDAGFDGDGFALTFFNNNNSPAMDALVEPDGKIVAAGRSIWQSSDFAVARYNPNGSLDPSWGAGKKAVDVNSSDDHAEGVAQQADGKLVVVGRTLVGSNFRFGLTRFNLDGTPDMSFGSAGKVSTPLVFSDYAKSVAIQPADQKIVVGGAVFNGAGDYDFLIARYNPDGTLDTSFGTNGFARRHNSSDDQLESIALLPDGDIVAAGFTLGGSYDIAALRFDVTTNSWDPAFGVGGLRVLSIAGNDFANVMTIDVNGKIVIAGGTSPSSRDFLLLRLNSTDGSDDLSFNGSGIRIDPVNGFDEEIRGLTIQPDGKIVVAGYGNTGANGNDFRIARYNSNGSNDLTFDFDGKQIVTFSATDDIASGVAVQSDGKIVVSGMAFNGNTNNFAFARLSANGALDTSFGSGGKRIYDFSGYSSDASSNLLIQTDGKVVAAGEARNGLNYDFGIARLLTNSLADCGYSLSQTSQNSPQAGGSYSVGVTTTGDCTWTATSNVSWITFTGATNGTGSGSVDYTVAANPNSALRTGTITIGGQTLSVTQFGSNVAVSIPTNLIGQNGSIATVPLAVSETNGQGIISYDFTVTYDPAVLTPRVVPFDATGTLSNDYTVTVNTTNAGTIVVSGFGTTPLSGAGTLLNLKFDVIGNYPACSALTFTAFEFNAGIPPNQTVNGQFCVVNGKISGTVSYVNGSPTIPLVPSVTLTATGATTIADTTDTNGFYELEGFAGGAYTVTPTKTGDVNGIQALDASRIAQHVVGLITLTPNQRIAGDTNNNGSLNSFDAALVAQYAVGIPNPLNIAGTWKFLPASRTYPNVFVDTPNQDYGAILVGDVTGNWAPPAPFGAFAPPTVDPGDIVDVGFPVTTASQGAVVTIPVTVVQSMKGRGVLAYELDFGFDPAVLQPDETAATLAQTLSDGMSLTVNNSTPGRSRIAVFGTRAPEGGGVLVNLRFRVVGEAGAVSPLSWTRASFNEGKPAANPLDGSVTVVARTLANARISGRVVTRNGQGIRNATLTVSDGQGYIRTIRTGSFGSYEFDDVPTGKTYTVTVTAKRHSFASPIRVVDLAADIGDADFIARE